MTAQATNPVAMRSLVGIRISTSLLGARHRRARCNGHRPYLHSAFGWPSTPGDEVLTMPVSLTNTSPARRDREADRIAGREFERKSSPVEAIRPLVSAFRTALRALVRSLRTALPWPVPCAR